MNKSLISVIVPIYNSENYLHRCIDSILIQSYTNFELLLIDDGSKDNSGCICEEYALKDSRVRVFHKENGGVSSARNLGLDNVNGEWVTFVDSDDWVSENYFSLFCNNCLSDLVVCGYKIDKKSGPFIGYNQINTVEGIKEHLSKHLSDVIYRCPWGKFFRNIIIKQNKLRFDERLTFAEDSLFVINYLLYIKSISFYQEAKYFYPGYAGFFKYNASISSLVHFRNEYCKRYFDLGVYNKEVECFFLVNIPNFLLQYKKIKSKKIGVLYYNNFYQKKIEKTLMSINLKSRVYYYIKKIYICLFL